MAKKSRKLDLFSLSAHEDEQAVDYAALFDAIAGLEIGERDLQQGDRMIALPTVRRRGGVVDMVMMEGPKDVLPLIYDYESGQERTEDLTESEVMATRTHAVARVPSRLVAVEYNHRGAKAKDLATLLEELGTIGMQHQASVELSPVVDRSFLEAIDQFHRITRASIRVARPNQDWDDWYDRLGGLAQESHAQSASLDVSSGRGRSISADGGIIELMRGLVTRLRSIVKNARVEGYREGEAKPTAVSLSRHVTHQRVELPHGADGQADRDAMLGSLEQFVSESEARQAGED